eukprot:gb/GECH01013272.1/.p1 GENE.gb/GECH01013272.1/~~gb/GECH01013272.1/.p1  ORF type:complete len:201 (+),score=28.33 gb/GECH01013272.1/:1-603(+)
MGEENSNKVESFLSCSYRNQRASIRLNQLLNILNNMYSGEPLRAQHSNHYGRFRGRTKDVGSPLLNYSSTNTSPSSPSPSPNLSSSSPHIRRRSRSITRTRTPISNSFTTATDQYSSYHIRSSSREKQRYSNRSHNDKNDIEMIRSNSDLSLGLFIRIYLIFKNIFFIEISNNCFRSMLNKFTQIKSFHVSHVSKMSRKH